ncbi:ABC transporter permease [Aquibacillus albus]|uniref:Peptide/nickel transport system permease protein n=1 Tax=Aquibacillus albus TaxID=1168171 RepID=A0ABS2N6E4_9BACI|nr:ABC transporter permease [Aquibacillus albus]MBM7573702.1 peptide/nickel transport system permease protein [Aquibacillus albus]
MSVQPLKKENKANHVVVTNKVKPETTDSQVDDNFEISFWNKFKRNKIAVICGAYLILIVFCAVFAPFLTTYSPTQGELASRILPIGSEGHFLGTDEQGRDMWTRIIFGARLSLLAAFVPVLIGTMIGSILGIVSGYFGGRIETLIMRNLDIYYAFPAIILAIALAAVIGSGLGTIIISLSFIMIPPISRVAMSATKKVAHMEYIDAAKTSGAGHVKIMYYHIFPNVFSPIFVYASTLLGLSLLFASGLSFLGLGVEPPIAEWGFMLNSLKDLVIISPMITFTPGFFIFITALALNLFSDGIRDAMQEK